MIKNRCSLFSLILLAFSSTAFCNESSLKPWVPFGQQAVTTGVVAATVVHQIPRSQAAAIPLIHFSSSQPAHALNQLKGEFGERMMDSHFTNRFLKMTGDWSAATPARIGRQGIDGLYFKVDAKGLPRDLLISDAKYGSARLGRTRDGKQMSESWIKPRLKQTADMYRKMADSIERNGATKVGGVAKNQAPGRVSIPLNDKTNFDVWQTRDGNRYFCSDPSATPENMRRQLTRMADRLDAAADGKIGYRSRLFSYTPDGKEHVFKIYELDRQANVIATKDGTIRGEFAKLPPKIQGMIRKVVGRALLAAGKTNREIIALKPEICNDPQKFNRLCIQPRRQLQAGLDRRALKISGAVGLVAMGFDATMQYWENGKINVARLAATGTLTAGAALAGNYAGTQASILLSRMYGETCGLIGGRLIGGSVASVLIPAGLWMSGQIDTATATKMAASGLATTATVTTLYALPQLAFWYATTYGITSGGVAISSLSGAAATNAALAWLGGGSLAAGGGGMVGGTAVMSTLAYAGPVAAVAIVAYTGYSFYKYFKNERDQHRYLIGIIDLTRKRVMAGRQREWQY